MRKMINPKRKGPAVIQRPDSISLSTILCIAFAAQILIIAGTVGYLSRRNELASVNMLASLWRREISAYVERHLLEFLETPQEIAQYNTNLIQKGEVNFQDTAGLQSFFLEQVKAEPAISSIYFGSADGGIAGSGREGPNGQLYVYNTAGLQPGRFNKYFVDKDGAFIQLASSFPGFDAAARPWYQHAKKAGEPVWSDVYILFTGQDMAVAFSAPLYDESKDFLGVLSIDIFLGQISDFLKQQNLNGPGELFIIEPDGMLVASSSNEMLFFNKGNDGNFERVNVSDSPNPLLAQTAKFLKEKYGSLENLPPRFSLEFELDGERLFVEGASLQEAPGPYWAAIIVIPESNVTAGLLEHSRVAWAVISVIVFISLLVSGKLAEAISNPLARFIKASNALSNQEWDVALVGKSRISEINSLALSFNQMSEKLQKTLTDLSNEVEERKLAQHLFIESEMRYRALMENLPTGMFRSTPSGRLIAANPAFLRMFGWEPGATLDQVDARNLYINPKDREDFLNALKRHEVVNNMTLPFIKQDQSIFWGSLTARTVKDKQGEILYIDGTIEDVSEKKRADEAIRFLATHDTLTQAPNRTLFEDRLRQALDRARRSGDILAVAFFDLDNFKEVNDAFGHKHGDRLLQMVAQRLKDCVRASDTIARLGGDEFAILLENLNKPDDAAPILNKISQAVARPFKVMEAEIFITTSMGVSIFPHDGDDPDTLVQNADRSMYYAKNGGKNNYQFFSLEMKTEVLERLELGNQLRRAVDQKELLLYYQPQVDALTGRVIGFEALLRWQHPTLGLLTPDKFLGLAQDLGLIIPLGKWVFETACSQARKWHDLGRPARVALNISEREARNKDLAEEIKRIIATTQAPPDLVEFELTEDVVFQDMNSIDILLDGIKDLGAKLAIDDFGTGYSSFGKLAQIRFDTLKIDKQFAPRSNSSPDELVITEGIIAIAQKLGMEVIAEGVETKDQLDFYLSLGCRYIQGWYYSPAVTVQEAEKLLLKGFPPA